MEYQQIQKYVILLFPLVSGFIMSRFCTIGPNAGLKVKFRPPAAVFGIAWTILYLCLGYAAMLSFQDNTLNIIPYACLVFTLLLWIIMYGCCQNKKAGVYVILLSLVAILMCMIVANDISRFFLVPLLVWLCFALAMNITEVQLEKENLT